MLKTFSISNIIQKRMYINGFAKKIMNAYKSRKIVPLQPTFFFVNVCRSFSVIIQRKSI